MLLRVTQDQELLEEKRGNGTALEERKHVFWFEWDLWVAGPKPPTHHHPLTPFPRAYQVLGKEVQPRWKEEAGRNRRKS